MWHLELNLGGVYAYNLLLLAEYCKIGPWCGKNVSISAIIGGNGGYCRDQGVHFEGLDCISYRVFSE